MNVERINPVPAPVDAWALVDRDGRIHIARVHATAPQADDLASLKRGERVIPVTITPKPESGGEDAPSS